MINKPLTVKELKSLCQEEINNGNGDKHIVISRDDEGNGFHGLWYSFTSSEEDIRGYDKWGAIDDCNVPLDQIIILG